MKKLLLISALLTSSLFTSMSSAQTMAADTPINIISDILTAAEGYGVFGGTDVAKVKLAYYNDKIYVYGVDGNTVLREADTWVREEVWGVIKKKLLSLNTQGYITNEKYDAYAKVFYEYVYTENILKIGAIYKKYLGLEQEFTTPEKELYRDNMYKRIKVRLSEVLKENWITQEEYFAWLEKTYTQLYKDYEDPNLVFANFDWELTKDLRVITPCEPCSTTCTSSSTPTTNCINPDLTNIDYYAQVKAQYGKRYARMSPRNLGLALTRAIKLEKRFAVGSKSQLKAAALVELLQNELEHRIVTTVTIN